MKRESSCPESREFFWSKVQREIQRLETPAPKPAPTPLFALLAPVSGPRFGGRPAVHRREWCSPGRLARSAARATAGIETALADSGAFTYRDYSAGTTLVWLSYPAENEVADDDEMGTIE